MCRKNLEIKMFMVCSLYLDTYDICIMFSVIVPKVSLILIPIKKKMIKIYSMFTLLDQIFRRHRLF